MDLESLNEFKLLDLESENNEILENLGQFSSFTAPL